MIDVYVAIGFALNYYCFALFFYCLFTFSNLKIRLSKDGKEISEKYNWIFNFLFSLTWVVSIPYLIISTLKINKNKKK